MYFTRHMRVLEQCIASASPEMQAQINALREAFSQDTSQSFELKPSLGLRSPAMESQSTPPELRHCPSSASVQSHPAWSHLQDATSSKTMSPASEYGQPFDHSATHSVTTQPSMAYQAGNFQVQAHTNFASQQLHQVTSAPHIGYALETVNSNEQPPTPVWDPSGIFSQWNSAFGGQSQPPPQPTIPNPRMQPTSAPVLPHQPSPTSQPALYGSQQLPPNSANQLPEIAPSMPTVTPVMWQDAFTTAYVSGHGNKRYRDDNTGHPTYNHYTKRRA